MKKTVVGFDIGSSHLKVAVIKKKVVRVHAVPLPENLIKDGVIKLPALMTDFLKEVKKEYKIKSGPCGIILPDALTIYRSMTLPPMTEKQLGLNLPFEFNDYISDEPENYVYDYSVQELVRDDEGEVTEMKLVAAAASKEKVLEYTNIFKNAGFKVQTVLPQEVAVTNLLKNAIAVGKAEADKEYCIINIGHFNTKVYSLKGDALLVTRTIGMGGSDFDKAIAENENVDIFMASTYGVCAPLSVDMTQFDYYANATTLGKSKMDLLQNSLLIGDESNTYPMQYVSDGIKATRMDIVNKFAGGSAADAKSVMNEEYNYYFTVWKDLMTAAGVSN